MKEEEKRGEERSEGKEVGESMEEERRGEEDNYSFQREEEEKRR